MHYLCIVFFMVLDLRLTKKIEVVVRQPFFFYIGVAKTREDATPNEQSKMISRLKKTAKK